MEIGVTGTEPLPQAATALDFSVRFLGQPYTSHMRKVLAVTPANR